jgi:hypothetical protein
MKKKLHIWLAAIALFGAAFTAGAQTNYGELRGTVRNADTREPIVGATLRLVKDGIEAGKTTSGNGGRYFFKTLDPGVYNLVTSFNEMQTDTTGVKIIENVPQEEDIELFPAATSIGPGVVIRVKQTQKRVIDRSGNTVGVTRDELVKMGSRSLNNIAIANAGGVVNTAQGISFRGSRADGTAYYVDGVRVIGNVTNILAGQQQVTVIQGGVPAQYGDFTGGAISVTTRGISRHYISSIEGITSSGLDPFGYNQLEGYLSGPLLIANKGKGEKEFVRLGFSASGNFNYTKDPSPSATGVYVVRENKLRELEENPLVATPQGLVHRGNYLTQEDLELRSARPNSAATTGAAQLKLVYQFNKLTDLTVFGSFFGSMNYASNNSIMNFGLNPRTDRSTVRTYARFTQKIKNKEGARLQNAFYTFRLDYQNTFAKTRDTRHLDNYFDYGHLGYFTKYPTEAFAYSHNDNSGNPNRQPRQVRDQFGNTVFIRDFWEQIGFRDTLTTFTPSGLNPLRDRYTTNLYDYVSGLGGRIQNENQIIQLQGLLNGFNPPNVYSLWTTPGAVTANWSKSQTERITGFVLFEGQMRGKEAEGQERTPHDLQFGMSFEQETSRSYGLGANGLWILMRQLANKHIAELDINNPILSYDQWGVFQDTVRYNRLVNYAEQSVFDRNLRNKLIQQGARDVYGNPIGEQTFIDINSLSPSTFSVNMFNADELLNNGNPYVSYFGYNYLGEKVKGRPAIDQFLFDPNNRVIGAFQPVYMAAWAQDQFAFKDLVLRLGVRVERYDANQRVLDDPYSLYPMRTAAELQTFIDNGTFPDQNYKIPDNIRGTYKVYVNDINAPQRVIGFRDGVKWYDAQGGEVNNPEILANQTSNGRIAPFLVDPNNEQITLASFKDYTPAINILPRIWFQFPIDKTKLFYASYDVLAQRPNSGASFLTIDELFFLKNRQGSIISNGDLTPRIKTDYEVGFKQQIGRSSGLELTASYSEIRNDFGLFQINQGYPVTYITYRNIDFSTVKSFRVQYIISELGPVSLTANYTLQFADGTGSNINSQQALIASNQPNLRTMIPLGELDIRHAIKGVFNIGWEGGRDNYGRNLYNGPIVGGKEIFRNTNLNMMFFALSGAPYTPTTQPVQIGAVDRAQIKGTPFGARLPWQFTVNSNLNKALMIKREGKKPIMANVYLWVENMLNARNIVSVFRYTGLPDDDGFLNSPQGQLAIQRQIDAQSYVDLYRALLTTQAGNFTPPRTVRLGVRFNLN